MGRNTEVASCSSTKNFIVYATDSQYMENEIRRINRDTFEIVISY